MNNNINNILEKYWNAETSLKEEAELKAYFSSNDVSEEHQPFAGLFLKVSIEQNLSSDIDISQLINKVEDIDALIQKYIAADSTLEEEKLLKLYFQSGDIAPRHQEFQPLFDFYKVAHGMTMDSDFNINHSANHIDKIINKYLKVESTIEEELVLKQYFSGTNVLEEHMEYQPLFAYYDVRSEMTTDIDIAAVLSDSEKNIDTLLDKYWEANTDQEEERILSQYFSSGMVADRHLDAKPLFSYYAAQRNVESKVDIESVLSKQTSQKGSSISDDALAPSESKVKVFRLRKFASAIAAIFILGFAAITIMNQSSESSTQYRGKYVQLDEEAEAQEAYEITKQAFALLSKKMNSGSQTVKKSVKKAENASIFK